MGSMWLFSKNMGKNYFTLLVGLFLDDPFLPIVFLISDATVANSLLANWFGL